MAENKKEQSPSKELMKKFSLHINVDDLVPATDEEKAYIVQMRPSTTFSRMV